MEVVLIMDRIDSPEKRVMTRRGFIAGAGSFLGGAALAVAGCSMLKTKESGQASAKEAKGPVYPAPYVPLDPMEIRKQAYAGYYKGR